MNVKNKKNLAFYVNHVKIILLKEIRVMLNTGGVTIDTKIVN